MSNFQNSSKIWHQHSHQKDLSLCPSALTPFLIHFNNMHLFRIVVLSYMLTEQCSNVSAFALNQNSKRWQRQVSSIQLSVESDDTPAGKKPLTSADILARARKAAGLPEEDTSLEGPQLFDDALLDDMQQSLLTLEKRVNSGPGTLSLTEVEELQAMAGRILKDMKEKENEQLSL